MTLTTRLVGTQQGDGILMYLANPTAGAANIVIHWPSPAGCTISSTSFTLQDAKQTTPQDVAGVQAGVASVSSKTVTIVPVTDSDVILTWIILAGGTGITPDSPQVNLGTGGTPGFAQYDASSLAQATAASIATGFSWTTNTTGDIFVQALLVEAPATAAVPDLGVFTLFD